MSREKDELGLEQWWDQFRYDPDYPDTTPDSGVDVTDPGPF